MSLPFLTHHVKGVFLAQILTTLPAICCWLTQANMGLLDLPSSRNAFIKGNLALLQLQSLAVGSVAGLFSFGLGVVVHPTTNNLNEIALMITASMLCAAISSFVLGSFMCGLVLVCRRYRINPGKLEHRQRLYMFDTAVDSYTLDSDFLTHHLPMIR